MSSVFVVVWFSNKSFDFIAIKTRHSRGASRKAQNNAMKLGLRCIATAGVSARVQPPPGAIRCELTSAARREVDRLPNRVGINVCSDWIRLTPPLIWFCA
jgi:hypothetical protein